MTLEILTENGFKPFQKVEKKGLKECKKIFFTDGSNLVASKNHAILLDNGYSLVRELQVGDKTSTGKIISEIIDFGIEETYDVVGVKDTWNYLSNGITSHNCAYVEGFDEFFASVYPTISSGQETKLFLTSTPYGLNHFYEIFTNAKKGLNNYEWIEVPWHRVPGRDEKWKNETLESLNFDYQKFDAEFNIEFLGSAGNLLSKTALEEITNQIETPIKKNHLGVKQYKMPEKNHVYVCVADVSRGKGLDYSAFQIIDVTSLPYEQVCVFHSNSLVPLDFGVILHEMVRMYNDALLLIENNDIGAQVADSLYFDFEYEYLVYTQNKGMKGKVISQGFGAGGQNERGIRTTKPVKATGCSNIKVLIENGKLKIRDYETVHEFYTFIKKGDSWEAEPGRNDDLVMCLVLFGWMSAQQYFEEFTDNSALKAMKERDEQELYDSLTPFGVIWDGRDEQDDFLIKDVDDF